MTKEEFAKKLKMKNPRWNQLEDSVLVEMALKRYPAYRKQVDGIPIQEELSSGIVEEQKETPGFLERAAKSISGRFGEIKKTFGETVRGEASPLEASFRYVGDIAAIPGDVIGAALSPQVEKLVEKEWAKPAFGALAKGMDVYEGWKNENELNRRTGEMIESVVNIADLAGASLAVKSGAKAGVRAGVKAATRVADVATDAAEYVGRNSAKLGKKAAKVLAEEPSAQVKTILKEATTEDLDSFIDIARKHSVDRREPSGFEVVGESISNATERLQKQLSSIGKQKAEIIDRAKVGRVSFSPRTAILKVSKLDDNPVKSKVLSILKGVETKLDADAAIDKIQDLIYTAERSMTIPKGSRAEKQLRGIIGELNNELKEGLPAAYRSLNDVYSDKVKIVQSLNRALSEVVDGVPTRGASLVKQYFSPVGSKAKTLFEYIKKETGIDLAQEATLAKFAEELFDNPNVRSLLSGIPKSRAGVIDKTIDFIVEKTGLGEGAQKALRGGAIDKARGITK